MELTIIAFILACLACVLALAAILRPRATKPEDKTEEVDFFASLDEVVGRVEQVETTVGGLVNIPVVEAVAPNTSVEVESRLGQIEKILSGLVSMPAVEAEEEETPNPGGCTPATHVWRKRWTMTNDHEHVYYCLRNCGSSLRHRFE